MNERIKQMAGQAGGEFWQRLENDVVNPRAYITFDPPASLEKFVGLIVRECCDVLQTETIRHDGYGYNQAFLHKKIKEHFGVEDPPLNNVDRILQTVRTRS
jgi:hypothetical protein